MVPDGGRITNVAIVKSDTLIYGTTNGGTNWNIQDVSSLKIALPLHFEHIAYSFSTLSQ